ncbi:MAG TPA: zf-HC2 domain-containing protein [Vicinamibacterales bacterium]|nr:zf-HC2 domain-containing protein [Vicinamibacterales bacterium]
MGNEQNPDRWLGNSLRQAATPPSEGCPDAETLAAWADGGLNAQAAAAVELHASSCARCMAVAAAMERSAPAIPASRGWTPARAMRWLIPLTAAATAVAIWVAVPQRSVVEDLKMSVPATEGPVPVPVPVPGSGSVADSARGALRAENAEPPAQPQEQAQLRDDDLRRERAAPPAQEFALEIPAAPQAAPEAAPAAPPAPSIPTPPAPPTPAAPTAQAAPPAAVGGAAPAKGAAEPSPSLTADSFAETVTTVERSAFTAKFVVTAEARVPNNDRIRWRVVASATIERSVDGGKTWAQTVALPRDSVKGLTVTGIRAMSDQNAIVQMSNGVEFLTSNGGKSWVQLQEK